jgi:hypothetical protein
VEVNDRRFAATTDNAGRAVFVDVPPGEYRVTIDREGYQPRRSTIASTQACVEVSVFLLSNPSAK